MNATGGEIVLESRQNAQGVRMVKCADCIYLVQTRHYLSQQVIGYHCFSIGRQQDYPDDYNFNAREIKGEHACEWFQSQTDLMTAGSEPAGLAPKIQRFVTIRVIWGYDWGTDEASEATETEQGN